MTDRHLAACLAARDREISRLRERISAWRIVALAGWLVGVGATVVMLMDWIN